MDSFTAGHIVLIPFPFSDLSRSKLRPAFLLADAAKGDWIACQITSNPYADRRALVLSSGSFTIGGLQRTSYVRPGKLFTANESLFTGTAGLVHETMLRKVRQAVIAVIQGTPALP